MNEEVIKKLDQFFSQFKPLKFQKGEPLLRADEPVFGIFFIRSGFVRQYVLTEEGDELTINFFKPLSFFPTMLIISGLPNKYYFEALDQVVVNRASPEQVLEFLKKEPEVLYDLARRFALSISDLCNRIENLLFKHSHSRIIYLLLMLARQTGEQTKQGILIKVPLTHRDISTWTGLTRETTSRQMERLEDRKLISYNNEHLIVLKNTTELETLASSKTELH